PGINYSVAEEYKCTSGYRWLAEERKCEACSYWTYGDSCKQKCNCIPENSLFCDHVTGTCRCALCNLCDATNTEACGQDTGFACQCKIGYSGMNCESSCSAWKYGAGCGSDCTCVQANAVSCNNINGTCTCKPGYIGLNCETACSNNTFGASCEQTCLCDPNNTLTCDNVNGTCTCATNYAGPTCNEKCSENTFGANCVGLCDCAAGQTSLCDKTTGVCVCNSGWEGTRCDEVSAFSLLDYPALVAGLGFLAAVVLVAIIVLILWCACRCSCRELKSRSRRKKDFIELTDGPITATAPTGGLSSSTAPTPIKTPGDKGIQNDNDGVYYGRDVLDKSSKPTGQDPPVAPPVATGGDEYYYADGIAAAAAAAAAAAGKGKGGKDFNPQKDVPVASTTVYQNLESKSGTSSPRPKHSAIKTPLPLLPGAKTTTQPVYGNTGVELQDDYANSDARVVSETYANLN
ncbi:multiple epidermal growth factor-like domains protein 10, partial [Ylistrum balloti]|uniref:multiple epidermal growth factor-like domains protein 10 n=1 Tax=Ylistrum balloti TaxID=509963 RepID=UPI002905E524